MRSNQRTGGNGHKRDTLTSSLAGAHRARLSEAQGQAGSPVPSSAGVGGQGSSDFVNLVLQVAEQGVQALGGAPQLLEHEAFFLVHTFQHRLQEAPNEAFRLFQHLKGNA